MKNAAATKAKQLIAATANSASTIASDVPVTPPAIELSPDGSTVTVFVPMVFRQRGGRTLMITPTDQGEWAPARQQIDTPLLNALVRAFRWKEMLESGRYATVEELATAEHMNTSYLAHVLRLTLLAPDIVDAILDGRQPQTMQLQPLIRRGFADEWESQRLELRA